MTEMIAVKSAEMPKRLAVFLDGTTDKSRGNTNVWRARSLCALKSGDDWEQRAFYAAGVGTEIGEIARGDVFGYGIDDQVIAAYQWLVENFESGDEIFVFGFSRGAYAARSLSGYISRCGLIDPGSPLGVMELYERYGKGNDVRSIHELLEDGTDKRNLDLQEKWMVKDCRPVPVKFTGVWDTVGSVAHTNNFAFLTGGNHDFLDVNLRKTEQFVYHAMAIDENRKAFDVTLLSKYKPKSDKEPYTPPRILNDVEQRWFAGAHGDVGGGTDSDAIAQIPLKWLLSKASKHGLAFKRNIEIDNEAKTAKVVDSFSEFLKGAYKVYSFGHRHWRCIGRKPEELPDSTIHTVNETIDISVFDRWRRDDNYRPENLRDWAKERGVDISSLQISMQIDGKSPAPD